MAIIKWLDENLEKTILGVFLSIMVVVMGIQVVARYVLNASLTWSEELTRFLFVWSAFLTLPYTIKFRTYLKIDQLVDLLPEKVRRKLDFILYILMIIFFIFMFYNAIGVVKSSISSKQRSPALGIPMYVVQVSSVIGFGLAIIRSIQSVIIEGKKIRSN